MKAVFRLPFSTEFLWIEHQKEGKNLVKFQSFDEQKVIALYADQFEILNAESLNEKLKTGVSLPTFNDTIQTPTEKEYLEKLETAIRVIKENQLSKLVISRAVLQETTPINLSKTYQNLCEQFPDTLCSLLIAEDQIWMGATPEILGKFNKKTKTFTTMSLAGTLPLDEDWGDKEIEEQKPVTDYIAGILAQFSEEIQISDTHTHISGNIKHLRTDFTLKISEEKVEKVIAQLHPTPAVCGIPKDFCKEKIQDIEQYHRELYTGTIKIETEEEIFCFVNLRCAKVYQNHILAFAGGGITAKSSPEKEWKETQLKADAIINNLKFLP